MKWLELLWFLPEGAEVLILLVVAFGLMLGLLSWQKAKAILAGLVISTVALAFLPSLLAALPWWAAALVVAFMVGSMVSMLGRLVLGRRIWERVAAGLVLKLLGLPLRLLASTAGWTGRRLHAALRWLFKAPLQTTTPRERPCTD